MTPMRIVEVGWLARYIKDLLAEDYTLQDVWVQGEISGFKQAASGHRYFTLKDSSAAIRCALFASYRVPPMRDGMAAIVHGRMGLWEQRGDIQFYVDDVRDAGEGLLNLRFEALKARLEAEGLFAPERKRPLPERVHTVGRRDLAPGRRPARHPAHAPAALPARGGHCRANVGTGRWRGQPDRRRD